jgi:serine/threonine protein kinase
MAPKICKKLSVISRTEARENWTVIQKLGSMGGALNGGISKVRCDHPNAQGMVFIEKRFRGRELFESGIPRREIQILHQIQDHNHITKMVDHFYDRRVPDGAVYLEYCAVGTLADVAMGVGKGAHVNEHKIWTWFFQLSSALAYCHRGPQPQMSDDEIFQSGWSRIYHRDIKPGNILLTMEDNCVIAKLADFGFAATEDYLALEHQVEKVVAVPGGTPGFDAPEYPWFGGPSDVWQLGLSILCVCTGIEAPRSKTCPQGEGWDKDRPTGFSYSRDLSSILKKCLDKDFRTRILVYPLMTGIDNMYEKIRDQLPVDRRPNRVFDAAEEYSKGMPPAGHRRPGHHFPNWKGPANLRHADNGGNPMPFYEVGFDGDWWYDRFG